MKELIILIGCAGSGKSTYTQTMRGGYYYINQDTQGRKGHIKEFKKALISGYNIVIDRMNFNKEQRMRYVDLARSNGYKIKYIEFKTPTNVCYERMAARTGHPTIKQGDYETIIKVIVFYLKNYEKPESFEYDEYEEIV